MLENFIFKKSLPKIFVRKLIGVNTKKYTAAITIGAIILPNSSPNFTHSLFKGVNILEFNRLNPKDGAATLSFITAKAILNFAKDLELKRIIICGGGRLNQAILNNLKEVPAPGMSLEETLLNTQILEKWFYA